MMIMIKKNPIPVRIQDLVLINKKSTCHLIDFAVPADNRVKMKESEKIDKYLDVAREQKLWDMRVMEIQSVVVYHWNGNYRPGKEIGGSEDLKKNRDYQTIALLESAKILRKVLEN